MQWPPTPTPGWWMWLYGCELAAAMISVTSIPRRSATWANSLARAMFTSRYVVSASLVISAASALAMARISVPGSRTAP